MLCIAERDCEYCRDDGCFRVSETESLINSHIYAPECYPSGLAMPALCNCGEDNSCGRLTAGHPTRPMLFDTEYTFACANDTDRYVTVVTNYYKLSLKSRRKLAHLYST